LKKSFILRHFRFLQVTEHGNNPVVIKGTISGAAVYHIVEQDFNNTIPLKFDRKPDIIEPLLCQCFKLKPNRFRPLFIVGPEKNLLGLRITGHWITENANELAE
jgi:hypothetical protein